jgi:predicted aspartyl protease
MPLIEAGFVDNNGRPLKDNLLRFGPTITVTVATPLMPGNIENPGEKKEEPKVKNVYALVDTGASSCMIDAQLATELGLIAIDKASVAGVSGQADHLIYMAAILIPQLDIHQFFGRFMAANLKSGGQEHEVLLGRDFLSNTVMIYDGIRAQVTLASAKK